MKARNLIIAGTLVFALKLLAASPGDVAVVVTDVSAVHTNANQIALIAHVYSRNPAIQVMRVEYFLDSTNNVIYGQGTSMVLSGVRPNSTNGIASARLSLYFRRGESRDVYIHGCGTDSRWTTFTKASLGAVTVNDVVNGIEKNYGK